jgi:hypothetical protein
VYRDADGDAPSYVRVNISGTVYSMSRVSGTYTEGALYRFSTALPQGSHTYYFEASDGKERARIPAGGSYSGPDVYGQKANAPPVLGSGAVFPLSGTEGTTFTFEAVYSDPDNDAPLAVGVYIDGIYHQTERIGENADGIFGLCGVAVRGCGFPRANCYGLRDRFLFGNTTKTCVGCREITLWRHGTYRGYYTHNSQSERQVCPLL